MKIIKERTPAKVFPFIAYKSEKTEIGAIPIISVTQMKTEINLSKNDFLG